MATLDDKSIAEVFAAPYVVLDEAKMTLKIDAVDCLLNFDQLSLKIKYTDARGTIDTELFSLSLNQIGCNSEHDTQKYAPILRPYFNLTETDQLVFTLQIGEPWTWTIPEPLHEDN